MNKIFIEAKDKRTSEYYFLKTILNQFFPDKEVVFIPMNGIGNLFNEAILNQMFLAQDSGEQVIVFADADTLVKGWGYNKRKAAIDKGLLDHGISFPYFLYPNNQDDGEVEILMENAARRDIHTVFFDCFEDYERCVLGARDATGKPLYNVPNLKGKLHTYMNAQNLSNSQRRRLGSGDWLFDNDNYWNLKVATLQPLKDFLATHLK